MTTKSYRVRFTHVQFALTDPSPVDDIPNQPRARAKSRLGCQNCRERRVKCDEEYPVCRRCTTSGQVCRSVTRQPTWQIELPGVTVKTGSTHSRDHDKANTQIHLCPLSKTDRRLLQHWFEKTSQIMVTEADTNPWSYSLAPHLSVTKALMHVLLSVSAAHEQFFQNAQERLVLEERGKALVLLQAELQHGQESLHLLFMTVYMLGVSTSFVTLDQANFGEEHLSAARAILTTILEDPLSKADFYTHFIVGAFVYWDTSCALMVEPSPNHIAETKLLRSYIDETDSLYHPITGRFSGLFCLLGSLGRYIYGVRNTGEQDIVQEIIFEQELWNIDVDHSSGDWRKTGEAFRKTGLLMLYRLCGRQDIEGFFGDDTPGFEEQTEHIVRSYALEIVELIANIPITSRILGMQAMLLLSAGAEMTSNDVFQRSVVRQRFTALVSLNRVPTNIWASQLLNELWILKDDGLNTTWLDLMNTKGWRLMLR